MRRTKGWKKEEGNNRHCLVERGCPMKAGIFQIGERSAKFTPAMDYLTMCVGCGHHTWCNHTKCVVCLSNVCPCLLGVAPLTVRRCTLPPSSHPFCEICNRCRSRQICLIQYACHVDTPPLVMEWGGGSVTHATSIT